jgi:hypothetical protein
MTGDPARLTTTTEVMPARPQPKQWADTVAGSSRAQRQAFRYSFGFRGLD